MSYTVVDYGATTILAEKGKTEITYILIVPFSHTTLLVCVNFVQKVVTFPKTR